MNAKNWLNFMQAGKEELDSALGVIVKFVTTPESEDIINNHGVDNNAVIRIFDENMAFPKKHLCQCLLLKRVFALAVSALLILVDGLLTTTMRRTGFVELFVNLAIYYSAMQPMI